MKEVVIGKPWIGWHIRSDGWIHVFEFEYKGGPLIKSFWKYLAKPLRGIGPSKSMRELIQWYENLTDPDHLEH